MKTVMSISAKCSDMFWAGLSQDGKRVGEYEGYVPKWFPARSGNHDEDYVQLNIDVTTGQILNWRKPTNTDLFETFTKPAA